MPRINISHDVLRGILAAAIPEYVGTAVDPATVSWQDYADKFSVTYQPRTSVIPDSVATLEDMQALGKLIGYAFEQDRTVTPLHGLEIQFYIRTIKKWGIAPGLHEHVNLLMEPKQYAEKLLAQVLTAVAKNDEMAISDLVKKFQA